MYCRWCECLVQIHGNLELGLELDNLEDCSCVCILHQAPKDSNRSDYEGLFLSILALAPASKFNYFRIDLVESRDTSKRTYRL